MLDTQGWWRMELMFLILSLIIYVIKMTVIQETAIFRTTEFYSQNIGVYPSSSSLETFYFLKRPKHKKFTFVFVFSWHYVYNPCIEIQMLVNCTKSAQRHSWCFPIFTPITTYQAEEWNKDRVHRELPISILNLDHSKHEKSHLYSILFQSIPIY